MKVEFFAEEEVFEGYEVVVSGGGNGELYVGAGNGAVAVELEEAHAVLYYVCLGLGRASHCFLVVVTCKLLACVVLC